jgi:hypothetical protein
VLIGGRLGNKLAGLASAIHEAVRCGADCVDVSGDAIKSLRQILQLPEQSDSNHTAIR